MELTNNLNGVIIHIDRDRMESIISNFRSIYRCLEKYIHEIINDFNFTKYEEYIVMGEVSNGLFNPIYDICILETSTNYKEIERKIILAINKFMNEYRYKEYMNIHNTSDSYEYDYGIISTDGNNTCIHMHISDFYNIRRFSVSIFNTGKENNHMCFDEAYTKMLEGHKITRPCFKGYWYINGVTGKPTIHLANGEEITSGDLSITLPNVLAKDWIVLE